MAIFKGREEKDVRASAASSESTGNQDSQGPTHDEIAILAYGIYLDRGGSEGGELEDWLEAEKRLLSERVHRLAPRSKSTAA
jgi:hypothetical protein